MRATSMALRFSITSIRVKPWRSKHVMLTQPTRSLSISSRGKPISREDLFKYTSGRFLVRDKEQCEERYLKFDVDQLCAIAASKGSKSPVSAIEKIEGGSNKALLMTKEDGSELVAKLPFSYAGPPKYNTASEAAVLQYLYDHTEVPVPKLLAWNDDASNPVGTEYIIMEKAAGCQLSKKWEDMGPEKQLEFIPNLCKLEDKLEAIEFPAYGSLYLRESLDEGEKYEPLAPEMDPSGRFCIGPSCVQSRKNDSESAQACSDLGPWSTLPAYGIAIAERQIARIKRKPRPAEPYGPPRGSVEEQIALLEMAKTVFSKMSPESLPGRVAWPKLWHTDLQIGNIFVSDEDPTKIVSVIDWQSAVVKPLFCQVQFPAFIQISRGFTWTPEFELTETKLPDDYDQMDEDDQAAARFKHNTAVMAKMYQHGCRIMNGNIFLALALPTYYPNLFNACRMTPSVGVVPLRSCLLRIAEDWDTADFSGDCPIKFTEDDIKKHEEESKEYQDHQAIHDEAREILRTDATGWVHPDVDFEKVQEVNNEILETLVSNAIEQGVSPEEVRATWPFSESS